MYILLHWKDNNVVSNTKQIYACDTCNETYALAIYVRCSDSQIYSISIHTEFVQRKIVLKFGLKIYEIAIFSVIALKIYPFFVVLASIFLKYSVRYLNVKINMS